jgi:hypothetical protein
MLSAMQLKDLCYAYTDGAHVESNAEVLLINIPLFIFLHCFFFLNCLEFDKMDKYLMDTSIMMVLGTE